MKPCDIAALLDITGWCPGTLAAELDVDVSRVMKWLAGKKCPPVAVSALMRLWLERERAAVLKRMRQRCSMPAN